MSSTSSVSSSNASNVSGRLKGDLIKDDGGAGSRKMAGLSMRTTAFFLVANLAGAGFLALPYAVYSTGWIGIPLLFIFCIAVGFCGTKLGQCWIILEERWEEYKQPTRQAYPEMAYRAFGRIGRTIIMVSILITQTGSTTVMIILISQCLSALIPSMTQCEFTVIVIAILIPFTWLGTPSDFWQASVIAFAATVLCCLVIFVQLLVDKETFPEPAYPNPTIKSFSTGFSSILYAFGAGSTFPTIQNDMKDRTQFPKSVLIAYAVAATGYVVLGDSVPGNILLYAPSDELPIAVKIAIGFEIINLLGTYLIAFNPVPQIIEEMLHLPRAFGWRRVLLRTTIVILQLVLALALPDFGLILNLVGGSTTTIASFLFPILMYMRFVGDHSEKSWPVRTIPLWQKILLWQILVLALIGGVASTSAAIYDIINSDFSASCFKNFK